MSYPAVQPPPVTPVPPPSPAGRPPTVAFAAALLWLMAGVGLIYAITTLAIVPGTVDRFRAVTGDPRAFQRFGDNSDPEYYVAVVWLGAAVALALAVIAFALFVVVGLSLRRGSNAARITTLIVCVLGILGGGAAVLALAAQQSGDSDPSSLGSQLSDAYPGGWIGTNAVLAVAQILGYTLVGILILTAPRAFFRRPATPAFGASLPAFAPGQPVPAGHPGAGPTGYPAAVPAGSPGAASGGYPAAGSVGYPPPGPPPGAPTSALPGGTPPVWDPAGPQHAWDPRLPGNVPGYPASGYPGAANSGYGQPAPEVSPYARPAGQAPEAAFAPQAPATPSMPAMPPPDPDSPYARPPQSHPDTTASAPDTTASPQDTTASAPDTTASPQDPPADPSSPYARPAPSTVSDQSAPMAPAVPTASPTTTAAEQAGPAAEVAEPPAEPMPPFTGEQEGAGQVTEPQPSSSHEAASGDAGQGTGTPKS